MTCPWVEGTVHAAVRKCPFLGQVAADHGEAYACSIAVNPSRPTHEPVLPESLDDFRSSFHLFHGASGVVPLVRTKDNEDRQRDRPEASCPFAALHSQVQARSECEETQVSGSRRQSCRPRLTTSAAISAAPFASLSTGLLRFMPGPGDFLARRRKRRQDRRDKRSDARQQRSSRGGPQNTSGSKMERWRHHPVLGGLIPLNAAGKYACPPLIVAGRAAVAKLRTTKLLRPQALPVKLLGVGGQCLAANIPFGALREHTEKFSVAWFLAVHATVPYFAFMRKGVGMPKWCIALTLAAAVAGQTIGAKLERARLAHALEQRQRHIAAQPEGIVCAERAEIGQKCPVLKTCAEIAQSHYTGSEPSTRQAVLA